jgi:DNA processing protein
MSDKTYWVALATTAGIGPRTFAALIERFGSPKKVFRASEEELIEVPRVNAEIARLLHACDFDQIENELYALGRDGISVLTLDDDDYPANLALIHDAPPVLFMRGALSAQDDRAVAIVGTREASELSARIATELAKGFAERGFTIVSGLARGIDTAAHLGALEGRTLAVLGSGIRVIHPKENAALAEKIAQGHGAVLSEFSPNTPPQGRNLMTRDRVISGLARGTIVVQAEKESGSMDTASRARKQSRLIFAVRGGGAGAEQLLRGDAFEIDANALDWDALIAKLDAWTPDESQQIKLL